MEIIHFPKSSKKGNQMKKFIVSFFLGCSFLSFFAHADTDNKNEIDIKTYKYSFAKNDYFKVSYADYPKGQEDFYELEFTEGAQLPPEIKPNQRGLKVSGNNHSDDLFIYVYKRLDGLKANTTYQVHFSLEFATNVAANTLGVGGSPGSSVFVKIGAVATKPKRYLESSNYYRVALDKGNQEIDGKDMILLGTIGVDNADSNYYQIKTLPYQPDAKMQEKLKHYTVTSNKKGEVWLILGTDSAFESKSTIFYTNVVANFKELAK
jgi:hypothetical protein